jgi:hypothetical protein
VDGTGDHAVHGLARAVTGGVVAVDVVGSLEAKDVVGNGVAAPGSVSLVARFTAW